MRALAILGAVAALALAGPATAHKGHGGLTLVQVDEATGRITVTHRLAAHDVEPTLASIAPDAQPSLDDAGALWALEQHLAAQFELTVDGEAVALSRTATRLAGDNIRVEFGGHTTDRSIDQVTIGLDFFPGVHEDQEILVNVRIGGVTRSARFKPGTPAQTIAF